MDWSWISSEARKQFPSESSRCLDGGTTTTPTFWTGPTAILSVLGIWMTSTSIIWLSMTSSSLLWVGNFPLDSVGSTSLPSNAVHSRTRSLWATRMVLSKSTTTTRRRQFTMATIMCRELAQSSGHRIAFWQALRTSIYVLSTPGQKRHRSCPTKWRRHTHRKYAGSNKEIDLLVLGAMITKLTSMISGKIKSLPATITVLLSRPWPGSETRN